MSSVTNCVDGGLSICFTCFYVPYNTVTLITCAFDGDAFMLDGLPAWTTHLEYQENCGPSLGQALH
jgi:hypothetical protein